MVPGSHRLHRQPTREEVWLDGNRRNPHVIPIEVPAGSAIVWHGNTWHGSFPRKTPGLRMNLATYFCREYMQPQEIYRDQIPEGYLGGAEDDRLRLLLGSDTMNGWTEEGPTQRRRERRAEMAHNRTWQY